MTVQVTNVVCNAILVGVERLRTRCNIGGRDHMEVILVCHEFCQDAESTTQSTRLK
jgi:hypothetical protein